MIFAGKTLIPSSPKTAAGCPVSVLTILTVAPLTGRPVFAVQHDPIRINHQDGYRGIERIHYINVAGREFISLEDRSLPL